MSSLKKTMQLGLKTAKVKMISYLPRFFLSIGVIFISYILAQLAFNHITRVDVHKETVQNGKIIFKTLGDVAFFSIIGFGIIVVLVNLGFELSTLFVVLGSVGLAVALALQDTISNISSGIMILLLNYYDIGDLIEIDDKMGHVDKFDLFTTSLKNMDGVLIKMPNNLITKGVLINYYKSEELFVSFIVTISNADKQINYDDIFEKIKKRILEKIPSIVNNDNVKITIFDMSSEGTKVKIKFPIKPQNYIESKVLGQKMAHDVLMENKIYMLDYYYLENDKSSESVNKKG